MMAILRLLVIASFAALMASAASAHTQSYSFLSLTLGPTSVEGRVELAVRDLDRVHDLDADRDGSITWGEFRRREQELATATLAHISIGAPDGRCSLISEEAVTYTRGGETYIVIPFHGACPPHAEAVTLIYGLLFASDAQHRGLFAVTTSQGTQTFVMTPAAKSAVIDSVQAAGLSGFLSFIGHGAHHIWIGYDHILFLLALLLPSVLVRRAGGWEGVPRPGAALKDVMKVVTAFTLAHSITLSLAALQVISLPSRLVESAIAASVVLAALNNLRGTVESRRWVLAFCFGLIHGFGFASVLTDLGLPQQALVLALVGFNVGVEIGQLAIVAVFLPLAFSLRSTGFYRLGVLKAGSVLVAVLAGWWFVQRAFDLTPV
jgi:hypothetical protein